MEEASSAARDTLQSFYDSTTVMMGTVEITGDDILHVSDNQATAAFFDTTTQAMRGRPASAMNVPPEYLRMWLEAYRASAASNEPVRFDYLHEGKGWLKVTVNYIGLIDGRKRFSYVVDDVSDYKRVERALQNAHDQLELKVRERTEELEHSKTELEAANRRLQHDAHYDALTGLPNRLLFMNRVQAAIERYQREPEVGFAVLFMDLDHFKVINDSLGHATGDALLVAVGGRLLESLREADTVARLGGDEFVVLLERCDAARAGEVVRRLREALAGPFRLHGRNLTLTGSVGVVFSEASHLRPQDLLRDADLAMYRAKMHRAGHHEVFDPAMRDAAVHRLELETDLRAALAQEALSVFYQPIVGLDNLRLIGFEALVRWRHPSLGLVTPGAFMPLAEETGLVMELDRQVLNRACRQVGLWRRGSPGLELSLNVNLSSRHFVLPGLPQEVRRALGESGLSPRDLNLEITERLLMQPTRSVDEVVGQLDELGVSLCIDDFGTGYASLGYLQRFPVRVLKIDRSFVQGLGTSPKGVPLVRAIVSLAESLDLRVVAEGVETEAQRAQLLELGCRYGQGYVFAEPLSEDEATTLVASAAERNYFLRKR